MEIRPIRTEDDYKAALREVSAFFDNEPVPGSAEGDRFEVLITLVEAYEAKHYAICPPDPIEAIKFRMDQMGLTRKDLETLLGGRGRVSEVLTRKRQLSLEMIRRLHLKLHIPLESLISTAA